MKFIQSLEGYFEHIADKTYIDSYPSSIINLDDLRDSVIVEFGSGVGNDLKYFISQLNLKPENLYFIESDINHFIDAFDKLEKLLFKEGYGDNYPGIVDRNFLPSDFYDYSVDIMRFEHYFQQYLREHVSFGLFNNRFPSGFVDFVYANNFFHCLEYATIDEIIARSNLSSLDKVNMALAEAFRLLKPKGVLFGRTLSCSLDSKKLTWLESKAEKTRKESFVLETAHALQKRELIGLDKGDFERCALKSGFTSANTFDRASSWKPIHDFYFRFEKNYEKNFLE